MKKSIHYSEILFYKAWAELKAECGSTWGGALWWFADPLLSMVIYYAAFGLILKRGGPDFISFLCVGIIIWRWFQCTLMRGASSVFAEKHLMDKVYIPKILFPAISLVADLIKFSFTLILLMVFLWVSKVPPNLAYVALPFVLLVQFVFMGMLVGFLSAMVPFVPDVRNMLTHGLHLMFFVSGIFFSVDRLDPALRQWVVLNPMAGLIASYRSILLEGVWPEWGYLFIVLCVSLVGLLAAVMVHRRLDRLITKYC